VPSLGFGNRLDVEPTIAIRERELDLVVDLDVVQGVGFFDLEHHRHRLHVTGNVLMGDRDVVLAFTDCAHLPAGRVGLAGRTARRSAGSAGRILRS